MAVKDVSKRRNISQPCVAEIVQNKAIHFRTKENDSSILLIDTVFLSNREIRDKISDFDKMHLHCSLPDTRSHSSLQRKQSLVKW